MVIGVVLVLAGGLLAVVVGGVAAFLRRMGVAAGVGVPGLVVTGWSVGRLIEWLDTAGLLVWAGVAVALVPLIGLLEWRHRTHTRGQVLRAAAIDRRHHGVATTPELLRYASQWSLRARARALRPSLRAVPWQELLRVPPEELGVRLVRHGLVVMWAAIEDVVIAFGRPRIGKSTWLIKRILDAMGAVVAVSTKPDLWAATHTAREARGPVEVFNPTGMADPDNPGTGPVPSTMRFDPIVGCVNPVTAMDRAEDMIPFTDDGGDSKKWVALARESFAALLYTAAVTGQDMAAVGSWVAHASNPSLGLELETLLEDADEPDQIMLDRLRAFVAINDRTKTSITTAMTAALAWLVHPEARKVAAGGHAFDVEKLIASRGTVYLIGGESGATAGLLAGLTGHIARESRRLAGLMPGGRLDPSLRICLDEADRICPVPLPAWGADMGGLGVNIIACFQSRAQVIVRWGIYGAKTIIDCAGALLIYRSANDADEADYWSRSIGNREEETETRDPNGMVMSRSTKTVPIVPPARLKKLRRYQAVVLLGGCGAVIGYPARRRWWSSLTRPAPGAAGLVGGATTASPALGEMVEQRPPAEGAQVPHARTRRPVPRPMPRGWVPGEPVGQPARAGDEG